MWTAPFGAISLFLYKIQKKQFPAHPISEGHVTGILPKIVWESSVIGNRGIFHIISFSTRWILFIIYHVVVNLYNTECFLYKPWRLKVFIQFEIIINVLFSFFWFIWIPMLEESTANVNILILSVQGPSLSIRIWRL